MGIFGKMFSPPAELYDAMLDNYRSAGLQVDLLPKDSPEAIEGGPCIKVSERNVNQVQAKFTRGMMQGGSGGGFGPSIGRSEKISSPTFEFDHIVKGLGNGNPEDLKAEVKTETKGTFTKTLLDFKWEGGKLADKLNGDPALKEDMTKLGATDFKVEADPEHDCFIVEYDGKVKNIVETKGAFIHHTTTRFENLPSIDIFNLCDRIAGYAKATLRPQHSDT